ncbi:hypothetical protein [Gracilimonas sp.]|uniref:hypothetical protein n=1 Tax=Gracilimonas sp. TaxID=1974203 RepID=UPI002871560B|nr:hypothetical protein [Gracilimonas sp.]
MKKSTFIIVTSLLILLNISLLYQVSHLNNTDNNTSNTVEVFDKWGPESIGTSHAKINHSEIEIPDSGIVFTVVMTDFGCNSCMVNEIRLLNDLYSDFPNKIAVYIHSNDNSYLEQFKNTFPVQVISNKENILDNTFEFSNPIGLIIDSNKLVQSIHMAQPENPGDRNFYYKKIESLLSSLETEI